MSRPRSWRSTRSRRAWASSSGCIGGALPSARADTEVSVREGREIDDPLRDRPLEADRQDRHLGVAGLERAVAAAPEMAVSGEVGELEAHRRRDDHLAGVRIRKRAPGPLERVGLVEDREVAARAPAVVDRAEAELLPR